ncbi:cation:proton antiporter [Pseudohalocynthiibacter aestuariivivens]|uniref:Cation:proton antiporter n=1 Tax=Pseudohalocynthiibacter aestuariivivens TaxID=1591409 RepID=A0ABV5JH75_9RHOB|nr:MULTISPECIES: cation:proton antiporter [Pseudohalocynthiibacter]MBS9717857.1 cation:proton antiporter [Pseudohalocynthiibacter aestuariivivens]MCK0102994.1 cation:proton antiporter [Pseudohalocynthiibacter sp. F2068]
MDSFLFLATIYLAAAVIAVPFAARLGLGSVLGYLLAGIVIGPIMGFIGTESQNLQHFAEFGVVMMLFLIGLELDPRALWNMRMRLIGLGGLQVVLTTSVITRIAIWLGQPFTVALTIGLIFSLSSTAIVLQTLNEKKLMQTGGGRSAFSVLLAQDILVIPMLAIIPLLGVSDLKIYGLEHVNESHSFSLVAGLPGWGVTLVTLGAIASVVLAGIFLTRPLFRYIHTANLREMYTAVALLIVIAIAFLMTLVGLSPALGTFLAGVVLANTEFRHELEADVEPFKGLLLGLFFITVGAGISFSTLFADPLLFVGLALSIMMVKGIILFMLGKVFKLKGRDQWLFTLGLAQAGEFGFVLTSFSAQVNVISGEYEDRILLVITLSMLLTPLFFILYDVLSKRMKEATTAPEHDQIDEQSPIIIAGVGRFGQVVNRMVQLAGKKTTVLDHDLGTIEVMRKFGVKGFFGDPTRPELLHAAGLKEAKVLVVAVDDPKAATKLVQLARRERPDLHIIARAHDRIHTYELYRAGANDIVREMFDGSLRAGRYVLENTGLSEFEAAAHEKAFYKLDRYALRETAALWDPGIPVLENKAYMERSNELRIELEAAILQEISDDQQKKQDSEQS